MSLAGLEPESASPLLANDLGESRESRAAESGALSSQNDSDGPFGDRRLGAIIKAWPHFSEAQRDELAELALRVTEDE